MSNKRAYEKSPLDLEFQDQYNEMFGKKIPPPKQAVPDARCPHCGKMIQMRLDVAIKTKVHRIVLLPKGR